MSTIFGAIKSIDISIGEVERILKNYVEADTGRKVKEINFDVSKQLVGYGQNEHYESTLKNVTIVFDN